MNKQPWLIDGEALKEWLNTQFSNSPYGAVSAKIKEIYNEVQSGRFNVKEAPTPTLKRGDKIRHKKDKQLGTGVVKQIAESGLRAYVDFGEIDDWDKKRRFKPYPAYYLLEKLEKVEDTESNEPHSEAEAVSGLI